MLSVLISALDAYGINEFGFCDDGVANFSANMKNFNGMVKYFDDRTETIY